MPLTQVKYMMIRDNLKFSSAAGDTWRELSMDAEEKLRDHHLYQGKTQRSPSLPGDSHRLFQDWNSVFWLWDFCPFLLDVKT